MPCTLGFVTAAGIGKLGPPRRVALLIPAREITCLPVDSSGFGRCEQTTTVCIFAGVKLGRVFPVIVSGGGLVLVDGISCGYGSTWMAQCPRHV